MTAARQTMAAWSKLIESRDDIPAVYKAHFDKTFDSEQRFPLVILTPSLEKFPRKTTEKLICDTDDALHIFEKNGNQSDTICYPYRDVYGSDVGIVLLASWLTVHGRTDQGETAVSKIEFNTTSKRYFEPVLSKLRPVSETVNAAHFATEKDKFNRLSMINYKFMSYGRESLHPGETVLRFLLQPEIRQPLFTLFGRTFYKTLSLAHLIVITDQELILIQETGIGREGRAGRYGGIWQYIPLHYIDTVSLSEVANDRLTLSILCRPDRAIERLFDVSNLPELKQLCSELQTLAQRAHATS